MKLELKTENKNYSKSFSYFFSVVFALTLIIILCDVALKLRIISRNQAIYYNCRLLSVEKSSTKFTELSRLSNLKSKQRILEFCRGFIK